MPLELRQHPDAKADLIGIWFYGSGRWGDDEADRYLLELERALQRLTDPETAKRNRALNFAGYRRVRFRHHRIYYYLTEKSLEIVRVMHERSDQTAFMD